MTTVPESTDALDVCLLLARADAELTRRFDHSLSALHGLSRNDFTLLRHLHAAPGGRLRRVDLAHRLGITASGVTRMLQPLERIGLADRESNPSDARAAFAVLTAAGRQLVTDADASAARIAVDALRALRPREVEALRSLLTRLVPPTI
jgi:DNA-binding MarR family transcriptional regulator